MAVPTFLVFATPITVLLVMFLFFGIRSRARRADETRVDQVPKPRISFDMIDTNADLSGSVAMCAWTTCRTQAMWCVYTAAITITAAALVGG